MTRTANAATLRRSLALSTALGATLGVFATPAAAQVTVPVPVVPTVTPFGTVTPGGTTGGTAAENPGISSNTNANGSTLNVQLNSRGTVLDWNSFNVTQNNTANFINATPTQTVAVLNRVTTVGNIGGALNTTTLSGRINAVNSATGSAGARFAPNNGVEVWISNPNGIIMGATGNFNTQGFIATTRSFDATDISNFLAGTGVLTLTAPTGPGSNANSGITGAAGLITSNGRVQAFIAPVIQLTGGTFNAGTGDVGFVTASDVTISNPGSPLAMTINAGTALNGAAQQVGGTVQAGSAYFVMSAQAGVDALLNVTVGATTASASGGVVVLAGRRDTGQVGSFTFANTSGNGGGADIAAGGSLTANNGGSVQITGSRSILVESPLATNGGGGIAVTGLDPAAGARVSVRGAVNSSGGYSVSGGRVVLGTMGSAVTQQAVGAVTVRSESNTLASAGALTLAGDTDGSGDAMQLRGRDGIDLVPTGPGNAPSTISNGLLSGVAGGDIVFDTDTANSVFRLGAVRAGALKQIVGGVASNGLNRTGTIQTGALTLSAANTLATTSTLTTGAVTTGAGATLAGNGVTVNGAIGNIAGQTGSVTINAGTGAASLQSSNLAGALSVTAGAGGVTFTSLAGAGAKSITSGAGISGASIAGAGTVDLTAAATGAINITGILGTSSTQRLGALTVNGGSNFTIGSPSSSGVVGWLSTALLGQTTAVGSFTARGIIDHSGAFTSFTSGATTFGTINAGGDFSVTTGTGAVNFIDLGGAGSKLINSGAGITGATINGASTVDLTAAASGAINITGALGASATQRLGALTVSGGSSFTIGNPGSSGVVGWLSTASLGQTTAVGSFLARGVIDHSGAFVSFTSGATTFGTVNAGGDLSITTGTGAVTFGDLGGTGSKLINSGAGITGTTINGASAVDLTAAASGAINITRALGAGPTQRLGALTVNGGSNFTIGNPGSSGVVGWLSTASLGQSVPLGSFTARGAIDHSGALTAAANTMSLGNLVSGGSLTLNSGAGGVGANDLSGVGSKTIAAIGPIGIRSIQGAGAVALSVSGGSSSITVAQGIGTAALPVGTLTIDGGTVSLNGFTVAGAAAFGQTSAVNGLEVAGLADAGSVLADAAGAISFGSVRAQTGDVDLASIGGGISFSGAVDGAGALIVQAAPAASVVFGGAVGSVSPFTSFASNGAALVLLNGGSLTTTGMQRYDGRVFLGAGTVLTGAGATFARGVNGATAGSDHDLALNFTGAQALAGGDFVGIRNLATDLAVAPTGGTTLSGLFQTSGSQTFNDAVTLSGAVVLRSTGAAGGANAGAITFGGSVDSDATLMVDPAADPAANPPAALIAPPPAALTVTTPGLLTFRGDVGATTALASVAAAGAARVAIQGSSVTTAGGQAYGSTMLDGPLTTGVTLTAGTDGVSFTGLNGPRGLTVNSAGLTALAGGVTPLAFVTTDAAGTTSLTGTIGTVGTQTYNDAVTLAGATTLNGALAVFGSTVTGNGNDLTINTSGVQDLGNITGVNNLATDAQVFAGGAGVTRLTGSIVTTGDQRYGDLALIVAADAELRAGAGKVIDIAGQVNGDNETHALTLTAGQTRLRGDVGTAAGGRLATLTVNGGLELLGQPNQRISTVGAQSYGGLVQLRTGATLIGSGASFGGGVDGGGQAFNDLTLTFADAYALPANAFSNIGSLRINGAGATTLTGDVTTRSGQFYDSDLVLAGPVTLASTNSGAIALNAVTGAQALTVNTAGTTSFNRGLSGLTSISTDAAGVTLLNAGLSMTGAVNLRDNVVLGADLTVQSTGGGALSFGGTIMGPYALTVGTSGLTSFNGAVGATLADGTPNVAVSPTALSSIGTGAVGINGGAITTRGAQSYAGQVQLGADAVLTGTFGSFGGGIVGNGHDLAVYFTNGLSVAGSITGVNNFIRGGNGMTALAGTIDTLGGQTYVNNVTLLGDTVLTSGGGTGTGAISFLGTVDGAQSLTVTSAGVTSFGGVVGGMTALTSVTVDGAGGVNFNGGAVTTTGAQSYAGAATLGVDTRLLTEGGDIAFFGPVNGAHTLSLRTGAGPITAGAVTLGGRIGGVTALTGLAIRANSATATVGGNRVGLLALQLNTGAFTYGDAGALTVGTVDGLVGVTSGDAVALSSNGLLTLNAAVGSGALRLTGTGVVSNLGAAITATGPITIDANDGAITLGDRLVTTDGSADAVRLLDARDVRLGAITTGAGGTVVLGLAGADNLSGALTQGAGVITAGQLVGSVGGAATLTNLNKVASLGAFSANGFSLRQADGLAVTGPVNAGAGALTLQVDAGTLLLRGDLVTQGVATLIGGGAISQKAGGITAASLTGSSVGGVSLTSATNAVPVLAGFTNTGGGGIAFTDSVALTVTADLAGGAGLALSAPGLRFDGRTLSATGDVSLDARTAALTGGTASAGGNLSANGGTVGLASATAGKGLALTATNGALTVSGPVNAGGDATATASGAITLSSFGTVATPIGGAATIMAGGALTASTVRASGPALLTAGGAMNVGTLNGGSVKASGLTVDIGATTAGSTLALRATGGALTLGTGTAGGAASLDASGALTVGTGLTAGGDAALTAGGAATVKAITSTGGGVMVQGASVNVTAADAAKALTVMARTGDVVLTTAKASGDATVGAAGAVAVGTLTGGGAANLAASGGALTLATGNIVGPATLTASGPLTISTALTSGGAASVTSGGNATVASITSTGAGVSISGAGVSVTDAKAATALALDAKNGVLLLTNGVGGTATLTSVGALNTGSLTTSGAATLTATGPVTITTALTSGGSASVLTAGAATVAAITSTGGDVSVTGGSVSVANAKAASALAIESKSGALSLTSGNAGSATLTSAGALNTGSLTTSGAATLTATGPVTIATALTSGGPASVTTAGAATVAAISSTGAGISITGASVAVADARAATALAIESKSGPLSLTSGNAATATLTSAGALNTGSLTTSGAATLNATGLATLGQSAIGAALTVMGNGISAGQTNAGVLTMTSGGAITVAGAQVGGNATFDANGLASLGSVLAGSGSTITIKALDAAITGTQRAGTVAFVNRAPTTVAVKLGNNTSAGGFALSADEVNNVEAGQLAIDAGSGAIEIGALAFDADAGRTRIDVMTTGRIDVLGTVSGAGVGRTVRFGGSTATADDKASVIRVVSTPTAGGRLLLDTADLELRGSRIGVGQAAGFLDPLGLSGSAGASVATVIGSYVGDPNSALYNPAIGGGAYSGAASTLVSAKSLTVRYTDYALFQNTSAAGLNSGVVLSPGGLANGSLVIQGPGGTTPNAFALFGTIGGISGSSTALLGPSIILTTGADLGATRVNGCLVGSGAGCLTAVTIQPLLSVFDSSRADVFRAADDLAVPFDPVVGTSNEALYAGLGLPDEGVTATECAADTTSPQCRQTEELTQ